MNQALITASNRGMDLEVPQQTLKRTSVPLWIYEFALTWKNSGTDRRFSVTAQENTRWTRRISLDKRAIAYWIEHAGTMIPRDLVGMR